MQLKKLLQCNIKNINGYDYGQTFTNKPDFSI